MKGPTTGITPGISVPTRVAKNASVFHGRRYPVNPRKSAAKSRPTPVIQVSSRGFRYALSSMTLNRCTNAMKIMRFAPQEWMERMSHPNLHVRHEELDGLEGPLGARSVVDEQHDSRRHLEEEQE